MLFIGDVHGCFKTYNYILFNMTHKGNRKGVDCSIQLGDMGIGFPFRSNDLNASNNGKTWLPLLDKNHKFIRGNHDDPVLCAQHPNFMGDWGYSKEADIFHIGGGYSIDFMYRTPGISWWDGEELTNRQFGQALRFYKKYKPKIVISHECPLVVKYDVITNYIKKTKISYTETKLQEMFEAHKPEYWIFGHHHMRKNIWVEGTQFVVLGELIDCKIGDCIFEIEDLTWEGQKQISKEKDGVV